MAVGHVVTPGAGRRFVLQAERRTRPAFHVCTEAATHQKGCAEDGDGTLRQDTSEENNAPGVHPTPECPLAGRPWSPAKLGQALATHRVLL